MRDSRGRRAVKLCEISAGYTVAWPIVHRTMDPRRETSRFLEPAVAPATPDLGSDFCSHWSDPEDSAGPALCANFRGKPARSFRVLDCAPPIGLPIASQKCSIASLSK